MSNPMMNAPRPKKEPDCLACRLTGAAAFTGLGSYAIYEASRQGTFKKVRPVGGPMVAGKIQAVIGFVFISLEYRIAQVDPVGQDGDPAREIDLPRIEPNLLSEVLAPLQSTAPQAVSPR
ncbi:uncharacterized protein MKK02DRAFT_39138 [Dioszegia hungarica]|uniref:Distal membrane-arm assembly complex protein 1-like domain-containing protein n=1 Tax=Dioszegia hungarica TaxID=4972 RepID=A0AA38LQE0_9TREE|nr:uncharacterized protein MKK02DRAFT_39138 [Dioszegia hungarica]KAI9633162.1 hypothetical protein MKK02DRAFT_39138 [Dioszegia hungarica]